MGAAFRAISVGNRLSYSVGLSVFSPFLVFERVSNRVTETMDGRSQAAKMSRMEQPNIQLWRQILHFHDLQILAQGRRIKELWHHRSKTDSIRNQRELQVVAFGLDGSDERQSALPECGLQYLADRASL